MRGIWHMETNEKIIYLLNKNKNKWVKGYDILKYLNRNITDPMELYKGDKLRKTIQIIREHNDDYILNGFIVANCKGYKLTNDTRELEQYAHSINKRRRSLTNQIVQLEKVGLYRNI